MRKDSANHCCIAARCKDISQFDKVVVCFIQPGGRETKWGNISGQKLAINQQLISIEPKRYKSAKKTFFVGQLTTLATGDN